MSPRFTTLVFAVASLLAAQQTLAQTATKSREEVKAEARAAAKDTGCFEANTMPKPKSEKSRAEVKAEAKGSATDCEVSKSPEPKSTASRADVKAETKRAIKAGEVPTGETMDKPRK